MTVAIPEAASVVEGRVVGSKTYETFGTRTKARRRAYGNPYEKDPRTLRQRAAVRGAARTYGPQAAGAYAAQARNVGRGAASASVPGDRSYQPVILAEFLIAVVLVAFTPIATGGSPNAKAKGSPSPYDTGDLRQLVAVGAVYFVLSLISSGNRGRISAWLGGLIVIGIAMTKMGKGQLTSLVTAVTGPTTTSGGGGGGGGAKEE